MNINKSLSHALTYRPVAKSSKPLGLMMFASNVNINISKVFTPSWTPFIGDVDKSKIGE
jgi:hypothetical protein